MDGFDGTMKSKLAKLEKKKNSSTPSRCSTMEQQRNQPQL